MAMSIDEVDFVDTFKGKDFDVILDEKRNAFDTWQRMLLSSDNESCVFMEDDIILCDDFIEDIENAISENPYDIITFFTLKNVTETQYLKGRTFVMNQCYYIPQGMIYELHEFSKEWLKTERGLAHPTGYDYCMADYMNYQKLDYLVWVPNLVQHKAEKSRLGNRSSKRQTKLFKNDMKKV